MYLLSVTWEFALQQLDRAKAQIKLINVMLTEITYAQMSAVVPHSTGGIQFPRQYF